jgi:hypothetical protein
LIEVSHCWRVMVPVMGVDARDHFDIGNFQT